MISLNTKRQTFEKNLIVMGYNYKIIQYEQFIDSIRKRIVFEIKNSKNKKDTLNNIFINHLNVPFLILEDNTLINQISQEYLSKLIEDGELDLYLKEKVFSFTKEEQKDAYLLTKIGTIKNIFSNAAKYRIKVAPFLSKRKTNYRLKLLKCIILNEIDLDENEKRDVIYVFNTKINDFYKVQEDRRMKAIHYKYKTDGNIWNTSSS